MELTAGSLLSRRCQHRPSGSSAGGIADDTKCGHWSNSSAQCWNDFISGGRPGEVPALAIGLITGGGVLALGGVGCLVGAWATGVQAGSAELAFSQYGGLLDRGHALDRAGMALTVTGGALVVGGAISWALLAPS